MLSKWCCVISCFIIFILVFCDRSEAGLTFMESLFVGISSACRALMDFQYLSESDLNQLSMRKNLHVIHVGEKMITRIKIEDAFKALTNPENKLFDISKETKIIIHGFNDNGQSNLPVNIAKAYADKSMFNVLILDAGDVIKQNYIKAANISKYIGRRLANLLANLENFGANAADFHIVGLSLGAHIAGWTGKYFFKYKKNKIGRVTGLDPSGPCFTYAPPELRVDKEDALFVDIIHVNKMVQGVLEPLGDVDFYVNGGGPQQPGCYSPACSHSRAAIIFEESIRNPKSFVGVKCDSWDQFLSEKCKVDDMVVMGYGIKHDSRGVYYLRTASAALYGLGMQGLKPSKEPKKSFMTMFNKIEMDMPLRYN